MNVYVIELKPSKPTGAYMDKLASYFYSLNLRVCEKAIPLMMEFNPWDNHVRFSTYEIRNKRYGMWLGVSNSPECVLTTQIESVMASAKRYRFDLSYRGVSGFKNIHSICSNDIANKLSLASCRAERWHDVVIMGAELELIDDNRIYLFIDFEQMNASGRRWTETINLVNPNPSLMKSAQVDISLICGAVGIEEPKDTSELIGKSLAIRVDGDDIKGFYPLLSSEHVES
jgi:hypothetical protein